MKRPWVFGLGVGIAFSLLYLSGLLDLPEARTLDLRFDLRGPQRPTFPIVLVTADDDSLAELNQQWPWPRSFHAKLIEQIAKGNPLAIGMDILFPEKSHEQEDLSLGQAVARARRVVLGSTLRTIATQTTGGITQHREIFEPPIPVIREGAAGIAFVELDRGKDSVVRTGVLVRRHAGQVHLNFSKALFDLVAKDLKADGSGAARRGRVWINFRGPGNTFPTYPYYQVYRGEIDPKTFEGKVVLVGATALSLHDRHPVPFSGANWLPSAAEAEGKKPDDPEALLMSGTEIQANLLHTLLADDPITRLPGIVYLVLILLVAVGSAVIAGHLRPLRAIAGTLGLVVAYLAGSQITFTWMNLWVEVVPVLLPLLVGAGTVISLNYIREERVRHEYARFFSPVVARQIAEDRSGQVVAGKRRRITVLFSDIRDFTSISEGLAPEEVVELLREYFNTMVPIVLKHGGTLDKYVGDAIMSLFGAPLPQEDHADRAVRAALEMVAQLPVLSPKWEGRSGRSLRIGVGVNTGEAVVGVMGADSRREYSAIGDTVNLASRLEGITKDFKTPIVVSQSTVKALSGQYRVRELSEVRVKGRQEAVRVYAVEAELDSPAHEGAQGVREGRE
ncbi:MAG TPA: adenylate/guanylate cyclase domain-containing protein [Candidatus Methylomirabilis sp.]|nr:adenylate/guanylate cyclase domain-containing protein [Candidatus Methylomirabilis sp.]